LLPCHGAYPPHLTETIELKNKISISRPKTHVKQKTSYLPRNQQHALPKNTPKSAIIEIETKKPRLTSRGFSISKQTRLNTEVHT
jgi:hypothetical protein